MTRFRPCIVLSVLLAAGCAGAPEVADEATPPLAVASTTPAVANAAPASSSADGVLVVDVNELAAATPPPLICRQMLKQNSNVIITRCLTEENWKRFYRQEALEAQEIVRMLRGSKYR
jgi:hypothetical protein